jgi:fructoselysine-6-P-deglycase FrlB-like protein
VGGGVAAFLALTGEERPSPKAIRQHNEQLIHTVTAITSEGSAAGYDSHGIVLSVLDLKTQEIRLVRARTPGDIDERGHFTIQSLFQQEPGLSDGSVLVMVTGAQTRAATQGDNMYSQANAHPHYEWANRDPLAGCLPDKELESLREVLPTRLGEMGPFAVGHNGDLNSKLKWERFFFAKGFYTDADADSKELPRILRLVWEALRADLHLKQDRHCLRWLISELYQDKVLLPGIFFEGKSYGQGEVEADLSCMLTALEKEGAGLVAQASAVGAKLVSWCDATSVYVFECLTDIQIAQGTPLTETILVRGPKAGGMVLYQDKQDPVVPIKYASSLSNLRGQIKEFDNQRLSEIPVDYIATGAKVLVREGSVHFHSLSDWEMVEVAASIDGSTPELRYYNILTGERFQPETRQSPIIDYLLRGQRETAVLKAEGEFAHLPVSERTVAYDTVLGEILDGPPSIVRRQIKSFPTEERPRYAVDNQYAAEILLSTVALQRNTEFLFDYAQGARGVAEGAILPKPTSLFRQDEDFDRNQLRRVLKRLRYMVGLGEGTSRNVAGIANSCANLEGLSDLILDARESNLARTESPRFDENTMVTFISNSGGTKPVVALAEEILQETGSTPKHGPFIWAVTNISTSELATLAGQHLGASITNLPWEKAVGSTFAAFTALQNILTMMVYVHQVRGAIRPGRARFLYKELASFPKVVERTLSSLAVKEEVDRLAQHISGNAVDIAFVGPLGGFDAAEAALKFSEMMQHSRVKFYSGAYEQHGQRATYLRALHANPGTLVILLVPNLETSMGSWMAQLIQENKPRAGRIAVLCAEEDAQALREAGADYVIAAPRGCTNSMFTDALSKMIMANMLTEVTIRHSNSIAGKIRGWGKRLLEASSAEAMPKGLDVGGLREELEVIRAQFDHLKEGDFGPRERRRILIETEKQLENEIITLSGREKKLSRVYLDSRRLTMINPAQLDRVEDLIRTLLGMEVSSHKDEKVFVNLLNDLILEFSERSLAMRLAEERFAEDAPRARLAVHYQGMAKIIGANPIKPDNIAKFQQGWGIPSFLLPPGTRRSDPTSSLADALVSNGTESCSLDRSVLLRQGFQAADVDMAEAFLKLVDMKKGVCLQPSFQAGGRVRSFEFSNWVRGPGLFYCAKQSHPHAYNLEANLVQSVTDSGRSGMILAPTSPGVQLQLIATDRFGDIRQAMLLVGSLKKDFQALRHATESVPLILRKVEFLQGWLGVLSPTDQEATLNRLSTLDVLRLPEKDLLIRLREMIQAQQLANTLPFRDSFEYFDVDPAQLTVPDLQTLHNVFRAVTDIKSGALYEIRARWENGRRRYWGHRVADRLYKAAQGTNSSYDGEGKELHGNKLITVAGRRLKMGFGRDGAHTLILPIPGNEGEISHLLLMHPEINESLPLSDRIQTLGEKYERIRNHASEYVEWEDDYLAKVSMVDLLMLSDEEIADDRIVPMVRGGEQESSILSASPAS